MPLRPQLLPQLLSSNVKWARSAKATAKSHDQSLSTMAQLTPVLFLRRDAAANYCAMLKPLDPPMGKVSLNDMVMFAVAKTIKSCPDLNANVLEENVVRHFNTVNLGFACDTPRGLIVPTIFNADQMTLLELSMEAKRLAAEAREALLSPDAMRPALPSRSQHRFVRLQRPSRPSSTRPRPAFSASATSRRRSSPPRAASSRPTRPWACL